MASKLLETGLKKAEPINASCMFEKQDGGVTHNTNSCWNSISWGRRQSTHVHLKPTWQQPPGSWAAVHLPGMEHAFWLGPEQGLEAGMVYRQSGRVYRLGLAVCSERCGTPPSCSSCGPAIHAAWPF